MRDNQPVTRHEFELSDDATLMSVTDAKGRITYANATFIQVSGFESDEILGEPHNIVRHPDMPSEAFADMWASLKCGEPWTALVKNRRKNGDYYWVRANAVPVMRNGKAIGYMSVRTKPSREDIASADALYRDFREGKAGNRRFFKGLIVRTGLAKFRSLFQVARVRTRIRMALAASTVCQIFVCILLGQTWLHTVEMAFASLVSMVGVGFFLKWQISDPLERVMREALSVASGESHEVTPLDRVDEIGMISRSIGQLGLMFRWLVADVSGQVANVENASREIALGNLDLSQRTEQTATSVQQTATAMAQMSTAVQSNAEMTMQADTLSVAARNAAAQGGTVVAEVVTTMETITASSKKVADIIGVIDGIAFQTNILALNAAVEAARAGEQGRGFAVVAGEVRVLAQRSASAAREIKTLIDDSVNGIQSGARLVNDAGRTMDEIVMQVKRVSELIASISSATAEQSTGMTQVDRAVVSLDEIAQHNAALVEQTAAASESLKQQARRLVDAISVFR